MNPSSIDTKQGVKIMRYEHKMTWGWLTRMGMTIGGRHRVTSLEQR